MTDINRGLYQRHRSTLTSPHPAASTVPGRIKTLRAGTNESDPEVTTTKRTPLDRCTLVAASSERRAPLYTRPLYLTVTSVIYALTLFYRVSFDYFSTSHDSPDVISDNMLL